MLRHNAFKGFGSFSAENTKRARLTFKILVLNEISIKNCIVVAIKAFSVKVIGSSSQLVSAISCRSVRRETAVNIVAFHRRVPEICKR